MSPDFASTAEFLERRARERPDALAFAFENDSATYSRLLDDARRIGGMLLHDGISAGDRVAILMPAGLDLVRVYYALHCIGAVPCIFDPHVPIATTERRIAAIRAQRTLTAVPTTGAASLLPRRHHDPDAIAFLQLTSGTSGEPLAAMIRHRNAIASLASSQAHLDLDTRDVFVGWVPPWHDLGLLRFVFGPVFIGAPCHLITPAVKTIGDWFAAITRERGTVTGAPDFAWRLATRIVDASAVDIRSLRLATNGGEPVRASTIEAFERRFGLNRVLCAGYGLAENTLGVSTTKPGEPMRVDARGNVSCGQTYGDVELRIEDDEILVRSPALFAGYFEAEEATKNVLRDGWLHTGDVGALDDDGNVYVFGRRRAMIKRAGAMVAPREVEEAAQTVPEVRVAAAVGVPSELTEEIVVVVEAQGDTAAIEKQVMAAVERAIGSAPNRVLVMPPRSIPRTSNGKIRHAVLRDQLTPSSMRSNPSVSSDGDASK
jgi:acyl-CoA synthetase (AMP-forming)/AMP-acid ligase II